MLVPANANRLDLDSGKLRTPANQIEDDRVRRFISDQNREKRIIALFTHPDFLRQLPGSELEDVRQLRRDLLDLTVFDFSRDQCDPVGRYVLDERIAVAVVDQASCRGDIHRPDTVDRRARDVFVVLQDLETNELNSEDAEQQENEAAEHPDLRPHRAALRYRIEAAKAARRS